MLRFLSKAIDGIDKGLEAYFSKKWHWLITVPAIVLTVVAFYFLFCFTSGLYSTADSYGYRSKACRTACRSVGGTIIGLSLLYVLLEAAFKKISGRKAAWAFLLISSTLLSMWGFQHALNLEIGHHDSSALGNGNHWTVVYEIYSTGEIPAANPNNQFYQPKLYHFVIASLTHFNRLFIRFGDDPIASDGKFPAYDISTYHAMEFTRVYMILLGIASFYAIYRIYRGLGISDKKVGICTAITVMIPEFWYIQFMFNNDGMALTLSLIAFALALEFKRKENILPLLFSASSLGLAMMCKINSALMAIPIAVVFVYVLVRNIKQRQWKSTLFLVAKFAAFAVIVFPLGLYVPISYKIKYDLPIGYVLDLTPTLERKKAYFMYIDPEFYNFFERCLRFPSEDLFYSPFNIRGRNKVDGVYVNEYGVIDFNCWTAFFKTGFFDEWSSFFTHERYVATSLLILGMYTEVFLAFFGIAALVFYIARFFSRKKYKGEGIFLPLLMAVMGIAYVINYIVFVNRYPVGCSQNSRYIMPIYLPIQLIIGSMIADAHSFLTKSFNKHKAKIASLS